MYAVQHHDELPASLDVLGVPLPVDPFTGKPFSFLLDGQTARLRGGALKGMVKPSRSGPCYEISVKKPGQ
jgi:hypothetical protein